MSPSAAPVRRSDSTARRSARYRGAVKTKSGSPPTSSHWPGNTAAMAIARSPSCCEQAGWLVNDKRVERIWRREGLKVPHKQPKRGRLWLADGSCIRLRPEHRNHVWSYDFVEDRTHDGRKYRMLNVIDEFTHECLAIRVARKLKSIDVIDVLSDLFILRGVPGHIRSDNGPEFVAKAVQEWITAVGAKTAYITPGSPWENGYVESFNARLRDELLRRRNLLHVARGSDRHRELAASLQHDQAACIARLQATSPRGVRACIRRVAGCATSTSFAGHASTEAGLELTLHLDHPMGSHQFGRHCLQTMAVSNRECTHTNPIKTLGALWESPKR